MDDCVDSIRLQSQKWFRSVPSSGVCGPSNVFQQPEPSNYKNHLAEVMSVCKNIGQFSDKLSKHNNYQRLETSQQEDSFHKISILFTLSGLISKVMTFFVMTLFLITKTRRFKDKCTKKCADILSMSTLCRMKFYKVNSDISSFGCVQVQH